MDRTAGGALGEVVQGGDGDETVGAGVHGHLHVDVVGSRWTKGSSAHPRAYAARTASAVVGAVSGAVTVARMPRDIGTSTGVNDTVGSAAPSLRKFCSISGT